MVNELLEGETTILELDKSKDRGIIPDTDVGWAIYWVDTDKGMYWSNN